MNNPAVSIITPVLNEEQAVPGFFRHLQELYLETVGSMELVIVDGGSRDNTVDSLKQESTDYKWKTTVATLPDSYRQSRAAQMNHGASLAKGTIYIFLHIDSRLPTGGITSILDAVKQGRVGGAFTIHFEPSNLRIRIVELCDHLLLRVSGVFFGDQAIFTTSTFFEEANGYDDVSLMEDLLMSDKLKRSKKHVILKPPVVTSSRRFMEKGPLRQMMLNTWLFGCFRLGMKPETVRRLYERLKPGK
jgi:rSAM/selenodomain-associated transferase 2